MSISKRTRFNVFKRDGFRCQYCGKSPPDVVLEVDHVIPVSQGGKDHASNLATACFDCNRGKAAGLLDVVPDSIDQRMARDIERIAQMKALNRWMMQQRKDTEKAIDSLSRYYVKFLGSDPEEYTLNTACKSSLRTFLSKLTEAEVMEAMDIAFAKSERLTGELWRFFCGVCWKKIRTHSDE